MPGPRAYRFCRGSQCILTTNVNLDEATCDIDLAVSSAEYFSLGSKDARAIVKQVALVTATWRAVATAAGATRNEIHRVASAFEHNDLTRALTF